MGHGSGTGTAAPRPNTTGPQAGSPGTSGGTGGKPATRPELEQMKEFLLREINKRSDPLRHRRIISADITNAAITNAKIQDATIGTAKIQDAAITTAKIDDLAVDTAKITDAAITTAKIQNLAVDTAKIADAAIETAKIANLAVDTAKITDAAISTAKIDSLAVTDAKINDVTADKITAGDLTVDVAVSGGALKVVGASGRVEVNDQGIELFDDPSAGTRTVHLDASDGSATFTGTVSASEFTGDNDLTGVLRTASSGQRTEIGNNPAGQEFIRWFTGNSSETLDGHIISDDAGGNSGRIQIITHSFDNRDRSRITLQSESGGGGSQPFIDLFTDTATIKDPAGGARMAIGAIPSSTETVMTLRYDNGSGAVGPNRVSVGAADSGGAGFRVLRVPN